MAAKRSVLLSKNRNSFVLLASLLKQFKPYSQQHPYLLKRDDRYWYYCKQLAKRFIEHPSSQHHIQLYIKTVHFYGTEYNKINLIQNDITMLCTKMLQDLEKKEETSFGKHSTTKTLLLMISAILFLTLLMLD